MLALCLFATSSSLSVESNGFSFLCLLPVTRDLLLTIYLLNWEKLSVAKPRMKSCCLKPLIYKLKDSFHYSCFYFRTHALSFTSYPGIYWEVGIPVFLCLKLNIFSPEKGSSGSPVSDCFLSLLQ